MSRSFQLRHCAIRFPFVALRSTHFSPFEFSFVPRGPRAKEQAPHARKSRHGLRSRQIVHALLSEMLKRLRRKRSTKFLYDWKAVMTFIFGWFFSFHPIVFFSFSSSTVELAPIFRALSKTVDPSRFSVWLPLIGLFHRGQTDSNMAF